MLAGFQGQSKWEVTKRGVNVGAKHIRGESCLKKPKHCSLIQRSIHAGQTKSDGLPPACETQLYVT